MRLLTLIFLLTTTSSLFAQQWWEDQRSNEGEVLLLNFQYGFHVPGGDLAGRFGSNFSTGGGIDFLTKRNLLAGFQALLYFGKNVNEDVLATVRSSDGLIFGDEFGIANVQLRLRGLYLGGHVGKIFRLSQNSRSGIRATAGIGLFQHKIRIQQDPVTFVSQLNSDYKKGYDRLTNGIAFTEFIGYHILAKNRLINFTGGFEFTQALTSSRRSFDFDTRSKDESSRIDLLWGIRIGWTLPFYIGENPDEIQY
ncbi:MAG: hypothetical protein ACE5FF_12395 [Saprospiraceae bacterium]